MVKHPIKELPFKFVTIKGAFGKTHKTKLHPPFKTGVYGKYGSNAMFWSPCVAAGLIYIYIHLFTGQTKTFHVLPTAERWQVRRLSVFTTKVCTCPKAHVPLRFFRTLKKSNVPRLCKMIFVSLKFGKTAKQTAALGSFNISMISTLSSA